MPDDYEGDAEVAAELDRRVEAMRGEIEALPEEAEATPADAGADPHLPARRP
jgi:hypothetical protein